MTQNTEKPREIRNGHRQFAYAARAHVGELRAAKDPRRQIVRFMPKAKLSSLPLNHRARAAVTATFKDSAPIPKMSRPAAMIQSAPEEAVMAGPSRHKTPKIMSDLRRPRR